MAFLIHNFNNVTSGMAKGMRIWSYTNDADTIATITADDYFADVGRSLDPCDIIFVCGSDGEGSFTVSAASSTSVTLGSSIGSVSQRVTIPTAEVLLLATTPKVLVAAPGANKILYFDGIHLQLDFNTIAYTEAADNLVVKYIDDTGVAVSEIIETTGFIDQVVDTSTRGIPVNDAIVANTGNENQPLVLDNNNANFAAGNSPLIVDIFYKVINGV